MADSKMKLYKRDIFLVALLLSILLIQSIITLKSNNLVFDEPAAITIGYYIVRYFDTSMYILHPPLIYTLTGLPLQFLDFKAKYTYEECTDLGFYKCAQDTIFWYGNDVEKISFYARFPFVIVSILLGLVVFFFARELYGVKAGILALVLYTFSPTILAYNIVIFTDIAVSLFIVSTIYFIWMLLKKGYAKTRLALAGISLGLALASKFTAIFLIPVIFFFFILKNLEKKRDKKVLKKFTIQFASIVLIGLLTLYAAYFFSFGTIADSIPKRYVDSIDNELSKLQDESAIKKIANFLIYDVKIPIPEYFAGFAAQYKIGSSKSRISYLNGQMYNGGKWYYFFEVMLIKTPVPLLIFFFIAFISLLKEPKNIANELFVISPLVVFLGIFVFNNFNLGMRHLLPVVSLMIIFSSRVANVRAKNKKARFAFWLFLILFVLWYVISSLNIMPHYIAYFNELVGPENGHKYLLSSNLDLGQDLKRLDAYLKHNNIKKVKLSYHGSFDPSYYNISYEPLPMEFYIPWVKGFNPDKPVQGYKEDCSKKRGIVVISVSNLHNYNLLNHSCFDWLSQYTPIKRVGYTIFVYNIVDQQSN